MANIININGSKKPSNSLVSTLTAEPAHVLNGKTFIGKNNREVQSGTIPTITLPGAATSSATSGYTSKAVIGRSTSAQYINIPPGYNATGGYYTIGATPLGTVITPTGKSATAIVTALKYTYNSTNDNFTVAHNTQASATVSVTPSVTVAGYLSSSEGTKTANNVTAYGQVNTTLAKIAGSVSISGTKTYTPAISRQAFTISGVTDAASGASTTTAPSSGVYVKVKSTANTGNVTAAATISTAGYGTASYHGITGSGNVAVGANASADTYVPIRTASPAFDGGAISGSVGGITGSNVTLSDTNNGIAVTAAASATRAAVLYNGAVNGYVIKADNAQALAASSATTLTGKTRYITGITVPINTNFQLIAADNTQQDTSSIEITNGAYRDVAVWHLNDTGDSHTLIEDSDYFSVSLTSYRDLNSSSLSVNMYNDESYTTIDPNAGSTRFLISSASTTSTANLSVAAFAGSKTSANWTNDQDVVTNGQWVQNTVTPSTSAQGPFYGRTTVNAISPTKAAATYNTSTSDQTITANQWLTGVQTIKAVTTSNITAANIKYNVNVKVGDANNAGRIANVTGTFTSDGTIAAADVLSGKIGYSQGSKITGTMPNNTIGSTAVLVDGPDDHGVWCYFNYGYWPQYRTTGYSYIYFTDTQLGTATTDKVLSGQTFTSNMAGPGKTGTMPNNSLGATANDIGKNTTGVFVHFPYGYWPATTASGHENQSFVYLPANSLGTATTAQVVSGTTFSSDNGIKQTGTAVFKHFITATIGSGSTNAYSAVADFGAAATTYFFACAECNGSYTATIYIQGSNDNTNWTNVQTQSATDSGGRLKSTTGNGNYRYWRIRYVTNASITVSLCRGMFWRGTGSL